MPKISMVNKSSVRQAGLLDFSPRPPHKKRTMLVAVSLRAGTGQGDDDSAIAGAQIYRALPSSYLKHRDYFPKRLVTDRYKNRSAPESDQSNNTNDKSRERN